jgi:Yip1 domain
MTDVGSSASTDKVKPVAVWEDFIDIFYAPAQVFARRMHGSVWVPLLIVTVVIGALFYVNSGVLQPLFDAEFDRGIAAAMRRNPRLTPEMAEGFRQGAQRFAVLGALVLVPAGMLLTGTAVWLIGKLFEAKQQYQSALIVAAYAWVPRILEAVLGGLQGLLLDPDRLDGRFRISLGIGRFLDPNTTSPVLVGLLGRVDLFTIWVTVLLAIGLSTTGAISRSRAFLAAPLIWAAGAVPIVFQALRQ